MLRTIETGQVVTRPVTGTCRVAIIGGGFSGASLARCLAMESNTAPGDIVVFEPRASLGAGLAYDVPDCTLRLNVAAHRMRALPDRPDAFLSFLQSSGRTCRDADSITGTDIYARRSDFAAFMNAVLEPFLADGTIDHRRERVVSVARQAGQWHIIGDGGTSLIADAVAIAIGNPAATLPRSLAHLSTLDSRLMTDAARIHEIERYDRVLVVGAGLTALDFLSALEARGHAGPVTILCRSGLLPQPHARSAYEPFGEFTSPCAKTSRALLHEVREVIAEAGKAGLPWHSVFDALRKQGQNIWRGLPAEEQRRFMRHLRRRYETHRFRMPPQNEALMRDMLAEGRLERLCGQIERCSDRRGALEVGIRVKPDGRLMRQVFERVAIATGPDQQRHFSNQPWLEGLRLSGHVVSAQNGLGIACDVESRALDINGTAADNLFVIGPPTRATFGEITGAPEIAAQAAGLAHLVESTIGGRHAPLLS